MAARHPPQQFDVLFPERHRAFAALILPVDRDRPLVGSHYIWIVVPSYQNLLAATTIHKAARLTLGLSTAMEGIPATKPEATCRSSATEPTFIPRLERHQASGSARRILGA